MNRRTDRELERRVPEMAHAIRMSKGDGSAANAVRDRAEEEGLVIGNDLMVQRFEVGQAYWFETAIWVYFGRVTRVGTDYVEIGEACRMHVDGRHSTMMATGTAEGIEIETTGGPKREMRLPIDWIGPNCEWPHAIPAVSVGPSRG